MLKWIKDLVGGSGDEAAAKSGASAPRPLSPAAAPAQGPLTAGGEAPAQVPISRHIILDRNAHILGYEFLLRGGNTSGNAPAQKVSDQMLISTINSLDPERIAQFREIWLAVSEQTLDSPLLQGLPAKSTVVLIRAIPNHPPAPEVLARAAQLAEMGFRIGLLGFADNPAHRAWLGVISLVAIDVQSYAPNELGQAVQAVRAQKEGLRVIARRIDSYEGFEFCHAQGFDGFAGQFLTRRENWPPQPPLNPDRVRLCDLLNRLRAGAELTDIAETLRLSPHISYRFLRYINSAGMGLTGHIASIEQGVLYLGREKLYRWLTLLLFSAPEGQITDQALLEQALMRGRMMELMGAEAHLERLQCDELFVVGVFSLFDVLLGLPLPMALRPLQLPKPVADALLEESGPYSPFLQLALACEHTDGDAPDAEIDALAAQVGLTAARVNAHHLDALAWAQQLDQSAPPA